MKIALSILCENPEHRTGLSTMFPRFVAAALEQFSDVEWLVFAGPHQEWAVTDRRVQILRAFPANDRLGPRLIADHFRVPPEARRRGADVMLCTGFVPLVRALPTAMQVFSLQHLVGSNRMAWARRAYRNVVTRVTWPKADLVIVNSGSAREQLGQIFPGLLPRTVVSPEGLQHDIFHPRAAPGEADALRRNFDLRPGYILSIANFYPYKQLNLILEAFARMDAAFRDEHPLVMAGGDWDGYEGEMRALAERVGVSQNVRFLGWVDDKWLAPLYRHASAFCQASREETFGRSVLESMACGTPVVAHDIPVVREVTSGQALVLNFARTEEAAAALRRAVQDADLRATLRSGGLTRARDFSFERLARERVTAIRERLNA